MNDQGSMHRWKISQFLILLTGLLTFVSLWIKPEIGLIIFWDVLIPLAPLIMVLAPGVWRNVCPLSSVSLISQYLGYSRRKRLPRRMQARLAVTGTVLLLLIIPLRHLFFNSSGSATAILLLGISTVAFICGLFFDWKSAWCAGLCPVHPVEKLYGSRSVHSYPNAHCHNCYNCSVPCPDSTVDFFNDQKKATKTNQISQLIFCGGFPGYIWGWFQIPDLKGIYSTSDLIQLYLLPVTGFLISLTVFILMKRLMPRHHEHRLIYGYIALAISTYYWHRIPALLGFGLYPGDGMLVNLTGWLPHYIPTLMVIFSTLFFFWWFLIRTQDLKPWLIRPPYFKDRKL